MAHPRALALTTVVWACLALLPQPAGAQPDCAARPGNQIDNCGFEAGNPVQSWTLESGTSLSAGPPPQSGRLAGIAVPGDLPIGTILGFWGWSNCFPVPSPTHYSFGASLRRDVPANWCGFRIDSFSTSNCYEPTMVASTGDMVVEIVAGEWVDGTAYALVEGPYASLGVGCSSGIAPGAAYFLDNAFAVPEATAVEIPTLTADGILLASAGILTLGILTLRRKRRHGAAIGQLLLLISALAAGSTPARAEFALSVDFNALWRVDLSRHQGEILYTLDTPDPRFKCQSLTVSNAGLMRCGLSGMLYDIRAGRAQVVAPLPGTASHNNMTFDGADRLWFVSDLTLWQLDPMTGAVIDSKPLSLVGPTTEAMAAMGDRLFVFTVRPNPHLTLLEEIDPETGASLSALDVSSLGVWVPIDASFDRQGDLWFSDDVGEVITGVFCYTYSRLRLSPLSRRETWQGCVDTYQAPTFTNIAAISGQPAVEIPAINAVGTTILALLTLAIAGRRLRLARRPP